MEHVVIIGNGIAGITAARHIRKQSNKKITVISAETDYFYARTALMYVFMGQMRFKDTQPYEPSFWRKNNISLLKAYVEHINTQQQTLTFSNQQTIQYDKLILALGSTPNKFGWPGQHLQAVQGLYSYQDLQSMEKYAATTQKAVIVGGGLIGVEMAEMFLSRGIAVTFLVREDRFWGNVLPEQEGKLIANELINHGVDLQLNTELKEILPDSNGRAKAVVTKDGKTIHCEFVGLTVGVSPNITCTQHSNIKTNKGVLVNEYLTTNLPNVYAIGDCAEFYKHPTGRNNIEQVWYTGRMMGETVAKTICGTPTAYQPGVWFNSAKFFTIEYQIYGSVPSTIQQNKITFYWQHPTGKICLRLVAQKSNKQLIGIHALGMRLRHEVCNKWILQGVTIDEAVTQLSDANFDPEFYKHHEKEIIALYNKTTGSDLQLKKLNWKRIFS